MLQLIKWKMKNEKLKKENNSSKKLYHFEIRVFLDIWKKYGIKRRQNGNDVFVN